MNFEQSKINNEDSDENVKNSEKPAFLKERNKDLDLDMLEEKLAFLEERKRKINEREVFTSEERKNEKTEESINEALLNIEHEIEEVEGFIEKMRKEIDNIEEEEEEAYL